MNKKPLGYRNYGSIPHLPGSRLGPADHTCSPGQAKIATEKTRDKHDRIIVQEKLDGSNVGVAMLNSEVLALIRAGYLARTSPYRQHHLFADWVTLNESRFKAVLRNGERLVGEWLAQAHGTRYLIGEEIPEPFIPFDLMTGTEREPFLAFYNRINNIFPIPPTLQIGDPMTTAAGMEMLINLTVHRIDTPEGLVYRVERNRLIDKRKGGERRWVVDFLVKYVRPDKIDGKYLESITGEDVIWNWPSEAAVSPA